MTDSKNTKQQGTEGKTVLRPSVRRYKAENDHFRTSGWDPGTSSKRKKRHDRSKVKQATARKTDSASSESVSLSSLPAVIDLGPLPSSETLEERLLSRTEPIQRQMIRSTQDSGCYPAAKTVSRGKVTAHKESSSSS